MSNLVNEQGIYVQDDSSPSSRWCPNCTRPIVTACDTWSEIKRGSKARPNSLPRDPSMKRRAKSSPSAGPSVSVDGSSRVLKHPWPGKSDRGRRCRWEKKTYQSTKVYQTLNNRIDRLRTGGNPRFYECSSRRDTNNNEGNNDNTNQELCFILLGTFGINVISRREDQ